MSDIMDAQVCTLVLWSIHFSRSVHYKTLLHGISLLWYSTDLHKLTNSLA